MALGKYWLQHLKKYCRKFSRLVDIGGQLMHFLEPSKSHKICKSTVWRFLKKLEIDMPYDPAIPLLGIHTKEIRIERDTCTPTFIAALLQ